MTRFGPPQNSKYEAMPLHILPISAVVYAKDASRLANFYEAALNLERQEEGPTYTLLASQAIELSIVQAPPAIADTITITAPPEVREGTPVKLSFLVRDIEAILPQIEHLGGGLKEPEAAWSWRGAMHLDGWDPEGNVLQLRQSEA